MPKATWKTMTIILVMSMVISAIAALPISSGSAVIENETPLSTWYVNGTTLRQSPASGIAGITVTLKNSTVDLTQPTDGNGKYSFAPVDGRGNYTLIFESEFWRHDNEYVMWDDFNATTYIANSEVIMTEREKISGVVKEQDIPHGSISNVNITITDKTDNDVWYVMTAPDGTFSKYLDAAGHNVELVFKKNGYYGNSTLESLTLSQDKDIGTVFMEKITPTPEELIYGYVNSTTEPKLGGVWVEVSEDGVRWIGNYSENTAGYYEIMTYSGRLMIRATEDNHETYEDWIHVPIEGSFDITMTPLPFKNCTVNGTVTDSVSLGPIINAVVSLYDNSGSFVYQTVTVSNGNYSIAYYGSASFTLVVSADGYFTDTSNQINWQNNFTGANTVDVALDPIVEDKVLEGVVKSSDSLKGLTGATVKVYNATNLYENETTTSGTGYFKFNIFDDTFTLLVDAVDYQSEFISVTDLSKYHQILLDPMVKKDTLRTEFVFNNWTHIEVKVNETLYVDNVTTRVNADREYGMGLLGITPNDWDLSNTEITEWTDHIIAKGLDLKDTSDTFIIDNLNYELEDGSYDVTIEGAQGNIATTTATTIFINKTYNYLLQGTLDDVNATTRYLVLNATYDSTTVDYVYEIVLPADPMFEMTTNMTETMNVNVFGYNNPITVDPETLIGEDLETVAMTLEVSMNGTAKAKITDGLHYVLNNTFDNYTVIVRLGSTDGVNTTATFSASETSDKVGDITKANFTWDFESDDTPDAWGIMVTHNFTTVGQKTVNLTVKETGGNLTYRTLLVKVDSEAPTAGISVDDSDSGNVSVGGSTLTVNEDTPLTFSGLEFKDTVGVTESGTGSTDDITSGDKEGIIEKWYWSWGEEGVSNETVTAEGSNNITHTYTTPGTFTLMMNTTDMVGHVSVDAVWTVKVTDTTAPEPGFEMRNATEVLVYEGIEDLTYFFNASLTTDNLDELEDMLFTWDFDSDGTIDATGLVVTKSFSLVGVANVTLIANDTAGNSKNLSREIYFTIGQRPDVLMKYGSMVFGSEAGTVGKALTISVNLTNNGKVNSTSVSVDFFIRNADGTDTPIGTASLGAMNVNENKTATVTWAPSKKGEYSIWANATASGEHESQFWDNKIDDFDIQKITVNEAGWVVPVIILVVIIVIIAVFFGMRYFMNTRMAADDKSGKRKKK